MKSLRLFALGALYLVSGIYSVGLSLFMEGTIQPVSGYTAFVLRPDPLFPYEVLLFMAFGGVFMVASVLEFKRGFGLGTQSQVTL